jgi:hypothetical protein
MIRLDDNLLSELGLRDLPDQHRELLLKALYKELEMRVGMAIAEQVDKRQLDEFEIYFKARDNAGALAWLQRNSPNYKDIVSQEFDKLCSELASSRTEIGALSVLYES